MILTWISYEPAKTYRIRIDRDDLHFEAEGEPTRNRTENLLIRSRGVQGNPFYSVLNAEHDYAHLAKIGTPELDPITQRFDIVLS